MSFNLRYSCLWIHRYTGLAMAAFLIIAGITGTRIGVSMRSWMMSSIINWLKLMSKQTLQLPIATLHDRVIKCISAAYFF